jgi:protein O-GlcNAc transferase
MPENIPHGLAAARRELTEGRPEAARAEARKLLTADPNDAEALHLFGVIETQEGVYGEAIGWFRRALALQPRRASWRNHLAIAYAGEGKWQAAADLFGAVMSEEPGNFTAVNGYGRALVELGNPAAAIDSLRDALRIRPDSPVALVSLAQALTATEEYREAAALLARASEADVDSAEPYRLLGRICVTCGKTEKARACWERVLELCPRDDEAAEALIRALWDLGELRETLAHCRKLIEDGRATRELHAFWLYMRLYQDAESRESVRAYSEEFGRRITPEEVAVFPPAVRGTSRRKLHIGYVCSECYYGAAYFFLGPLIGNHNREDFEIFLYYTYNRYDQATEWFQTKAHWRNCHGVDGEAIRQMFRRDEIDILVDVTGLIPNNRLPVFAGRAAPIQAAYPNCPITTGVKAIDYIFTDRWTCPEGHENQYTEEPVFLPSGYLAYLPPEIAPEITDLPARRNGFVTFGLFQRRAKMNGKVWDLVAEVLRRLPDSRLLVQNNDPVMDQEGSRSREELIGEFGRRGIAADRLTLAGRRSQAETLAHMAQADVALDTFPYQGQTTTCECLWLGVPVVALSGAVHVARVGSALLERVGLGQLATRTPEEYVERAVELAGDLPALAELRAGMRQRLRASPLLDGRNLSREAEEAYRRMWGRWQRGSVCA